MTIVLSTWIPRSYLHLREANSKIKNTGLDIQNVKLEENLTFDIKNVIHDTIINFALTPVGIYTVTTEIKTNTNEIEVVEKLKNILLDSLIKNWHTVIYKQIKNGVIPLKYSTLYFSDTTNKTSTDKLERHYTEAYTPKNLPALQAFQFLSILTIAIDDYILKMSKYYHKVDNVIKSLKGDFELSELKKTVFEMDYVEKNTGEIMARISDSRDCLEREAELINDTLSKDDTIITALKRAEVDLDYTDRLWQQMDVMLDNLDNASNARLSYQETVESRRVEWFLSVEAASVIATLLASAFISEFTGINALFLSLTFLIVWIAIYFIMKKIRAK
jgi:hypothetical protein